MGDNTGKRKYPVERKLRTAIKAKQEIILQNFDSTVNDMTAYFTDEDWVKAAAKFHRVMPAKLLRLCTGRSLWVRLAADLAAER